jgi:hypothetical protein
VYTLLKVNDHFLHHKIQAQFPTGLLQPSCRISTLHAVHLPVVNTGFPPKFVVLAIKINFLLSTVDTKKYRAPDWLCFAFGQPSYAISMFHPLCVVYHSLKSLGAAPRSVSLATEYVGWSFFGWNDKLLKHFKNQFAYFFNILEKNPLDWVYFLKDVARFKNFYNFFYRKS